MSTNAQLAGRVVPRIARLRRFTGWINASTSIVIVFVVIQLAATLLVPHYASLDNLKIMMVAIPALGIVTLGVTLLMIAGEFDLSVGSIFVFAGAAMAVLNTKLGVNPWLALFVALAVGAGIGLLNGYITTRLWIPSFIMTLGTMMIFRALATWITSAEAVPFRPHRDFADLFAGSVGPIPAQFLWLVGLAFLAHILLAETPFGNWIFAAGGDKNVARALGINTDRVKVVCFIIVGMLAALASAVETTRLNSLYLRAGENMNMLAIAAAVIGGTSLFGGAGGVLGAVLGAITIYSIQDILLLLNVSGVYFEGFVGSVILVTVVLSTIAAARNE
jgi:simple sugar transport system permease protein